MTSRLKQCPVIVHLLVLMLLPATSAAAASGPTAKAALAKAKASAQAWQSDAVLHQITSTEVSVDGTLTGAATSLWHFHFFSASAKSSYTVIVGPTVVGVPSKMVFSHPIDDDFVDSDRALAEAKQNGLAPKGKIVMTLTVNFVAPLKKSILVWTIRDRTDSVTISSYFVDPKTGKLVGKT